MRTALLALPIALLTLGASAQWAQPTDDVPAYHAEPPAPGTKLAPILTEAQLRAADGSYISTRTRTDNNNIILHKLVIFCGQS